jgi:putative ATP-binding cassette transporter
MSSESAQPGKWASFKLFVARAWALTRPYYLESDEKWKARALLAAIIALNLGLVYMAVLFNDWNKLFYDALQDKKADVFWTQLGRFTYLAFAFIIIAVYKFYLTQLLEMRWRAWMTRHYLQRWLANTTRFTGWSWHASRSGTQRPPARQPGPAHPGGHQPVHQRHHVG